MIRTNRKELCQDGEMNKTGHHLFPLTGRNYIYISIYYIYKYHIDEKNLARDQSPSFIVSSR